MPGLQVMFSLNRGLDCCYGLAEDGEGRLVTINSNKTGREGRVTEPGQADVFFIDVAKDKIVKRLVLEDVTDPEEKEATNCR